MGSTITFLWLLFCNKQYQRFQNLGNEHRESDASPTGILYWFPNMTLKIGCKWEREDWCHHYKKTYLLSDHPHSYPLVGLSFSDPFCPSKWYMIFCAWALDGSREWQGSARTREEPIPKVKIHGVKYCEKGTAEVQNLLCWCISQFNMEKGRAGFLHLYK